MFRKFQSALFEKLCTENNRVHQYVLSLMKMLYLRPRKQFPLRKCVFVTHYLTLLSLFLIDKITDKSIERPVSAGKFPKCIKYLIIRGVIYPVITVYYLEKQACRIGDPGIYRRAMPSVLFVYRTDYSRVFRSIFICDLRRAIFRTIINDKYLHILSTYKK